VPEVSPINVQLFAWEAIETRYHTNLTKKLRSLRSDISFSKHFRAVLAEFYYPEGYHRRIINAFFVYTKAGIVYPESVFRLIKS